MPIYQPPSVPSGITPYMRMLGNLPAPSGVPRARPPVHTVNGTSRARNRTVSSRRPYPIHSQSHNRARLELQIEIVMLPHDVMLHFEV